MSPSTADLRIETIHSLDALGRHREAYDRLLADLTGGSARNFTIDALRATAAIHSGAHDVPVFLLAWDGATLRGVAPWLIERRRWPRLRRLHSWGGRHGLLGLDPEVLVPLPDWEDACMRAFAAHLAGPASGAFDRIDFESVRETSVLGRTFARVFPGAACTAEEGLSHLVDLPDSVDAFRAGLDVPMLREMQRCGRALLRDRHVVEYRAPEQLAAQELREVMAIHTARQVDLTMRGKEREHLFEDQAQRTAFERLLELDTRERVGRHYLLKIDGRVAAFGMAYADRDVLTWHTTAFDPAYRRYGPGRLIAAFLLEHEIGARRTRVVDMGKGVTPVKRDFANRRVGHLHCTYENPRSLARIARWHRISSLAARWRGRTRGSSRGSEVRPAPRPDSLGG